jgi:hypothetical protein
MTDGTEALRAEAQRLLELSALFPNGRTKALLLRMASELFELAADEEDPL